jgi:NADH-quinone oxidoreductase subunit A
MDSYLPLVVMAILAGLFLALSFTGSKLLGARANPNPAKTAAYECGIVPEYEPAERFPVKFSMVAMAFVVFDVEIVFLYPWAVTLSDVGTYGLVAMGIFAIPFIVSFGYELSQGVLDWGPRVAVQRPSPGAVRRTSTVDVAALFGGAPTDQPRTHEAA